MVGDLVLGGAHSPLEAALKRLHGMKVRIDVEAVAPASITNAPSEITHSHAKAMQEALLKLERQGSGSATRRGRR